MGATWAEARVNFVAPDYPLASSFGRPGTSGERFVTVGDGDGQLLVAVPVPVPALHQLPRHLGSGRVGLDVELATTVAVVAVHAGPTGGRRRSALAFVTPATETCNTCVLDVL
jgi:hypothetical protein